MMKSMLAPIVLGLGLAACGASHSSSLKAISESAVFTYDFTDGVTVPQAVFFSDYSSNDKKGASEADRIKEIPGYAAKVKKFVTTHGRQPDAFEIGNMVVGSGNIYQTSDARSLASAPDVKGIVLTHINRSDDVDTNIVIELGAEQGLEAGVAYDIAGEVEFYSNTPTGGFGIGGAPDAVQYGISVSDSSWEAATVKGDSHYRTFTNKVRSTNPFGDVTYAEMDRVNNGKEDGEEFSHDFLLNSVKTASPVAKFSSTTGKIFVNFRTHSGYEGYTIFAVKSVKITVSPAATK